MLDKSSVRVMSIAGGHTETLASCSSPIRILRAHTEA